MTAKHILHLLSPSRHASPFDIHMALDAGFDAVIPYGGVTLDDVYGLTQDAMFSRPPQNAMRTGIFFGGKDAILALDMLDRAKSASVPPFIVSLFADPAGSFTTAAAMVAKTEKALEKAFQKDLAGVNLLVFGATGVVGFASAVIAALQGARVTLVGHDGAARVEKSAAEIGARFDVAVFAADGSTEDRRRALLEGAQVAFCAGRAGVQIIDGATLNGAKNLLVVADVNAVPPAGVEGLDASADGVSIGGGKAVGIGALAIGHVKYKTEFGLFRKMIEAEKAVAFDFRDAFSFARDLVR